ncbi:MAG: type II secretion system protein GspI [Gammaproteobacteria bacterium]|nr:MAG: type II secretion system protein GspI [Gammaproteobacteria bacterium]
MKSTTNQSGITLLELLVALAVFSISAMAILDTIGTTSRVIGHLEQKTIGHWVAGNQLADLQLKSTWPNIRVTRTEVEMSDRLWFIVTKVEATARADMRKITVEVRLDKDHQSPLTSRVAFAGNVK